MKWLFVITYILLIIAASPIYISHPSGNRCMLCAIETLANIQKIAKLKNLSLEYEGPTNVIQLINILDNKGVKYKIQFDKTNVQPLASPCVIGVYGPLGLHTITIIQYQNETFTVYDCSKTQPHKLSWKELYTLWDGLIISLEKD